MTLRDGWIWAGAALLSVTLHLSFFLDRGSRAGEEQAPKQQSTRVSFRSVAAPATPPQLEPELPPEPEPEPEVVEAPEPPPPEPPKPKEPEKRAEKVRQPEPPKPRPRQPTPPATPTVEAAEKQPVEQSVGSVEDPALIEQAKNEYLRRLMAHIDSHKHYPRVARRRGIEGDVAVSFKLLTGGAIDNVQISEGHRVLRQAVQKAIDAALPMPPPPAELKLPMALSFSVRFALNGG